MNIDSLGRSPNGPTPVKQPEELFLLSVRVFLPSHHHTLLQVLQRPLESKVHEVARYVGMNPNSTAQLIKRARAAFKAARITAQLSPDRKLPAACTAVVPQLAANSRGKTTKSLTDTIDPHLIDCGHCIALSAEANNMHKKLALALLSALLLGGPPGTSRGFSGSRTVFRFPATQPTHISRSPASAPRQQDQQDQQD